MPDLSQTAAQTPTQTGSTLIPSLRYKDAPAAIEWLERALGFVRHSVYPGENNTVQHAELRHGTGMIMLGSATNPSPYPQYQAVPSDIDGRVTSPLYLVVADCDPFWTSVQAAGAHILMELRTMDYGGRAFAVRDPEGYHWSVGEYDPWAALQAATAAQSASKEA